MAAAVGPSLFAERLGLDWTPSDTINCTEPGSAGAGEGFIRISSREA